MPEQPSYETIDKFDREVAGLLDGNGIYTKPTTVQEVNTITGESETFILRTARDERGDHVILTFVDKTGNKRLILPPRVVNTIARHRDSLTLRARRSVSKATMKARKLAGEDLGKSLREWRKKQLG